MAINQIYLTGTTDASGDLVVNSISSIFGFLYKVDWVDGGFDDGVDATLTVTGRTQTAITKTLLTLTDANDDADYYPREYADTVAGAENTSFSEYPLIDGYLTMTVASGGNKKAGGGMLITYFT